MCIGTGGRLLQLVQWACGLSEAFLRTIRSALGIWARNTSPQLLVSMASTAVELTGHGDVWCLREVKNHPFFCKYLKCSWAEVGLVNKGAAPSKLQTQVASRKEKQADQSKL